MAYPKVMIDGREFVPKLAPAINVEQTLAQYLQQLRELADLSVQDVAQITGLRTWSIEAYERNAGTMHFSEAALLARCYGVSLDLFGARVTRLMGEDEGKADAFIAHDGTVTPITGGKKLGPGGKATNKVPPQVMMNTLVQYDGPSPLTAAELEQLEIDDEDDYVDEPGKYESEDDTAPPSLVVDDLL